MPQLTALPGQARLVKIDLLGGQLWADQAPRTDGWSNLELPSSRPHLLASIGIVFGWVTAALSQYSPAALLQPPRWHAVYMEVLVLVLVLRARRGSCSRAS